MRGRDIVDITLDRMSNLFVTVSLASGGRAVDVGWGSAPVTITGKASSPARTVSVWPSPVTSTGESLRMQHQP